MVYIDLLSPAEEEKYTLYNTHSRALFGYCRAFRRSGVFWRSECVWFQWKKNKQKENKKKKTPNQIKCEIGCIVWCQCTCVALLKEKPGLSSYFPALGRQSDDEILRILTRNLITPEKVTLLCNFNMNFKHNYRRTVLQTWPQILSQSESKPSQTRDFQSCEEGWWTLNLRWSCKTLCRFHKTLLSDISSC